MNGNEMLRPFVTPPECLRPACLTYQNAIASLYSFHGTSSHVRQDTVAIRNGLVSHMLQARPRRGVPHRVIFRQHLVPFSGKQGYSRDRDIFITVFFIVIVLGVNRPL